MRFKKRLNTDKIRVQPFSRFPQGKYKYRTQLRKSFSFLLRLGWRSFRRALASI